MRRIPLFIGLLLASSALLAQNQGVLVLKSDQPYVSPFDKTAPVERTVPQAPVQIEAVLQEDPLTIEVREAEKKELEKRAKAFLAVKPTKRIHAKQSNDSRTTAKKNDTKTITTIKVIAKDESKPTVRGTQKKVSPKTDALMTPSKSAQTTKSELAPPPALSFNDNGLSRTDNDLTPAAAFSNNTVAAVVPIAPVAAIVSTDVGLDILHTKPAVEGTKYNTAVETPKNITESTQSTSDVGSFLPTWLFKAIMFFIAGGLLMLGGWYWLKRQALYGDPAFQDPWFRPIKARSLS